MIANYKKIADTNLDKLNKYIDANKVSPWAKPSVKGVIAKGYMGAGETFGPKNNITRAETIVTINRIITGNTIKPGGTTSNTGGSTSEGNNGSSIGQNTIVYVTPSCKSYHSRTTCVTLKRSKKILSMTLKQAIAQGKYDPCNICKK